MSEWLTSTTTPAKRPPTALQKMGNWLRETFTMSDMRQDTFRFSFDDLTNLPALNYAQGEYEKLNQMYYGSAESGIQLGALFAQPIVKFYTAFLIGQLPKVVIRDRTAKTTDSSSNGKELDDLSLFANRFLTDQHANLLDIVQASVLYGDVYAAFNLDRNLEAIPPFPHKVLPGFNLFSSGLHTFQVGVTRSLRNPDEPEKKGDVNIVRTYTPEFIRYEATTDSREISLKDFGDNPVELPHLLGVCPVIHIPNNPMPGQQFGWSEFAHCLPYMNIFHHVLVRGFEAQQYAGKPILAVTGIEGTVKAWLKRTFDIDVTQDSSETVQDKMKSFFAKFKFFAFAGDVKAEYLENKYPIGATPELLDIAFKSIVKTSMLPEFMFGVAIESANASVREQYVSLKAHIRRKRVSFGKALSQLIKWALYYYSTFDTNPETGQTLPTYNFISDPERLHELQVELIWPQILNSDEQVKLEALRLMLDMNGLSFEGAYENLQEFIPDAKAELQRVKDEYNDPELPPKGGSSVRSASDRNEPGNRANQRGRDAQGSGGDSTGRANTGRN